MDVDGGVRVLNRVGALHLDQCHAVLLDEEVERALQTHVGDAQPVRLPFMEEQEKRSEPCLTGSD